LSRIFLLKCHSRESGNPDLRHLRPTPINFPAKICRSRWKRWYQKLGHATELAEGNGADFYTQENISVSAT
jgi:hypothetical protein